MASDSFDGPLAIVLRTELQRRSMSRVVRTAVTIKSWIAQIPSVDEVRPHRCVGCGAASRPVGGRVAVQGHRAKRQIISIT
jgi:hypothetical protein